MSEDNEADTSTCCASCGIAEIDDIKWKDCDGCDLVRYCSDECKRNHKLEHEEACTQRAAELREELLFRQPESSHRGDCPICSVPMPLDEMKSTVWSCCSKFTCNGCTLANQLRTIKTSHEPSCPFCREPTTGSGEEEQDKRDKLRMKRVEANDPVAIHKEGMDHLNKGNYIRAFEYWTNSAEMGVVEAHYDLAHMYHKGIGVEKNKGKEIYHLEEAAIGGHPLARHNLGCNEYDNANIARAVKHWIIAATQGNDGSIKALMEKFKRGLVEKDVLATTLRAHKAAVDATKSPQRTASEKYFH